MRAATQGFFRLLPGPRRWLARPRRPSDWAFTVFLALVVVFVLVALASGADSERRALRRLPHEQRLMLLAHTVDELHQLCGDGRPAALKTHCRDLASFAAQFDECRGDCEAVVRHELTPPPTR